MNYGPELLTSLADELNAYCGYQLQKVDGGGDWCVCSFKGKNALFFTWNAQIFGVCSLTSDDAREIRATSTKTPFILGIQKRLSNSTLDSVSCVEGDRILIFKFKKFVGGGISKETSFILELTGRMSNAIITDENGNIVEAAHHVYPDVNRYRSIIPGILYVAPPPIEGAIPTPDMDDRAIIQALKKPRGIGKTLAAELYELGEKGFVTLVRDALFTKPTIYQSIGKYLTAAGVELPGAIVYSGNGLEFCRKYIVGEIRRRSLKNIASRSLKLLDRTARARARYIDGLRSQIEKGKNCEHYRLAGEALLQNLNKVNEHQSLLTLKYWDAEGEKEIEVSVNPLLSFQANAKAYFKKYQKYHTNISEVSNHLTALEDEMNDIEALKANIEKVQNAEKLTELCEQVAEQYDTKPKKAKQPKKPKRLLPPHLRFPLGESLILVGMNERGNRYVTFQEASADDIWFHVHERPGSHVILKNPPNDETRDRAIHAAASLALFYSRCEDATSVIDYTYKKHVRHIQGSGPANVTYKFPSTVLVSRDEWEKILHR